MIEENINSRETYIHKIKTETEWDYIADILGMAADVVSIQHPTMADKLRDFAKDFKGIYE